MGSSWKIGNLPCSQTTSCEHSLFRVSSPWFSRQQRQLSFISEFTSNRVHLPGSQNVVADALSRPSPLPPLAPPLVPVSAVQPLPLAPAIDFSELSTMQPSCPETSSLLSNPSLRVISVPYRASSVLCDISTGFPRPPVSVQLVHRVFEALHNLSIPGVCSSQRLVSRSYMWAGLPRDVSAWARTCIECQRSKVHQHICSSVPQFPVAARRFSHIHVDLMGPLPSSRGFTHLFSILNRTSRWPVAVPLSSISEPSSLVGY